jgi:hypothetical protein
MRQSGGLATKLTIKLLGENAPDLREQLLRECVRLRDVWMKAEGPQEAARVGAAFSE